MSEIERDFQRGWAEIDDEVATQAGQEPMAECCNADCGWTGKVSECLMLGSVGPLCPECREVVETDPKTPVKQGPIAVIRLRGFSADGPQYDVEGSDTLKAHPEIDRSGVVVFAAPVACPKCADAVRRAEYWKAEHLAGNAEITALQAKVAELEQQCSDLEGERDDVEHQPWPEWSESILKIIRKRSGYDGFDDADGIDLPEELRELLAGNDAEFDRERAKLVAANERIAEIESAVRHESDCVVAAESRIASDRALIEKCEKALLWYQDKNQKYMFAPTHYEALAAIAAQKGGAA